jgi:predicted ATPase
MELLEREDLHMVVANLDDAARGHGRMVLLRSEVGIGRTAVVRWFGEQVAPCVRVMSGGCVP